MGSLAKRTVLFNGKLDVKPTYDIQVSHNMMHNLDKEMVKFIAVPPLSTNLSLNASDVFKNFKISLSLRTFSKLF